MSNKPSRSDGIIADDAKLAAACRNGDLDAFEQVVLLYQRLLYNVAVRIIGNEADAAEIVQDALLSAWKKIGEFRGDSKLSTWLTAITVNQARSRWQKLRQRRQREESLDLSEEDSWHSSLQIAGAMPSPLAMLEKSELNNILERCVNQLDEGFREVLILRDMRELSYDEVGQVLGLRDGTVKSRLFRAREAVRDCIKKRAGTP